MSTTQHAFRMQRMIIYQLECIGCRMSLVLWCGRCLLWRPRYPLDMRSWDTFIQAYSSGWLLINHFWKLLPEGRSKMPSSASKIAMLISSLCLSSMQQKQRSSSRDSMQLPINVDTALSWGKKNRWSYGLGINSWFGVSELSEVVGARVCRVTVSRW